jgi:MFS family permease
VTADAGRLRKLLDRVLSDDPLVRATAIQSAIFAFGTGTFITGEAVYSIKIIGLTVAEAGLGLTIGMGSQFLVSIPFGRLADRIGARTCWGIGNALQAAAFLGWLFVHGFWPFIGVVVAREVTAQLGQIGWSTYRLAAFPRDVRVRSGAYNRAALNVGFTLGALFGGIALATGSLTVIRFIPILTAAILLVSAAMIRRLPAAAEPAEGNPLAQTRPAAESELPSEIPLGAAQPAEALNPAAAPGAPPGRPAIKNVGFVITAFFDGLLSSHQTLLLTVIPLWLVADTNAPRVLLAWLFATNTIGAVVFQVPVSRTVTGLPTAMRAEARAAAFMVASCLIILVTDHTAIWLTIPLIWLAHVTVTGAELFESSASWSLQSELSDQSRLGDYQGVASVASTVGTIWTPALYTFLATNLHAAGWLIIAGIVVLAAAGIRPSARMAQRFLEGGPSTREPLAAQPHDTPVRPS